MEDFLLIVDSHEWRRMLDFSSRIGFKINAVSPFRLLMASGRSPARTNRLLQSTCLEVKARHPRNDVGHVRLGLVRSFAPFFLFFFFLVLFIGSLNYLHYVTILLKGPLIKRSNPCSLMHYEHAYQAERHLFTYSLRKRSFIRTASRVSFFIRIPINISV